MIKKQKKWVAVLVAFAFVWLLQVSSMPLGAAGAKEQVSSASSEQAPGFLEVAGYRPAMHNGKRILPYVLIGVGVLAVAAVLVFVVFKTSYNIVGTWTFVFTGPYNATNHYTFTGTKSSGSFTSSDSFAKGTYAASGKKVTFTVTNQTGIVWTGTFTGKDTMTGSWVDYSGTYNFTATRVALTTGVKTPSSPSVRTFGPSATNK